MTYLLVKSAHLFVVISWMVGFLYLPRLMVYHADAEVGSDKSETFKIMERRLMRGIMTPSMIGVWVLGIWLAFLIGAWSETWFQVKLVLVLGLTIAHFWLVGRMKAFAEDRNDKPARFYRIINEVPAVAMVLIILLVIVKPF